MGLPVSRLTNPGVGDISDRLTILALKRLHGTAAGHDVSHFDREWATLHTMLRGRTLNAAWFEQVLELGAVNAKLWALTDQMRHFLFLRSLDGSWPTTDRTLETANCGCDILTLNDRRADLVQKINELAGDNLGAEKLP